MESDDQMREDSTTEPSADEVADIVGEVRRDLAARRERGELPELPEDELDRQFSAVVEAVEAGVLERPPVETGDLTGPAVLETWRPMGGRRGPIAALVGLLLSPLTRIAGLLVRRQVGEFSTRTAHAVEQLADRQNGMQLFLSRSFLDRQRRLEFRVAELEREVERLRSVERDLERLRTGGGGD
jgi:hypothetical protein